MYGLSGNNPRPRATFGLHEGVVQQPEESGGSEGCEEEDESEEENEKESREQSEVADEADEDGAEEGELGGHFPDLLELLCHKVELLDEIPAFLLHG